MSHNSELLVTVKAKVEELERKVFGEDGMADYCGGRNTVMDYIFLLDRELATIINPMARYYLLVKSMKVLNELLEDSLKEDDLEIKLNVIFLERRKFRANAEVIEQLKDFNEDMLNGKFKNVEELKTSLSSVLAKSVLQKQKAKLANEKVALLLNKLNEVSYELSRYFFLVHEAFTKLENSLQAELKTNCIMNE